jgi:hypothetical protein
VLLNSNEIKIIKKDNINVSFGKGINHTTKIPLSNNGISCDI